MFVSSGKIEAILNWGKVRYAFFLLLNIPRLNIPRLNNLQTIVSKDRHLTQNFRKSANRKLSRGYRSGKLIEAFRSSKVTVIQSLSFLNED